MNDSPFRILADKMSLLPVCIPCGGQCCTGRTLVDERERDLIVRVSGSDHFKEWRGSRYFLERGSCAYLIDQRCSVQEAKPFVCKIFPYVPRVVEGEMWLYRTGECPASQGLTSSFVEAAKKLAQEFFATWAPHEYAEYWEENKLGDFDDHLVLERFRVYDEDRLELS